MPLHVGLLVAYTFVSDDPPKLGYIVRLQRVGVREEEVAIARLRETVTAVVVEELDSAEQHTLPALLIRDSAGDLHLLCDRIFDVKPGDHLVVVAVGLTLAGVAGEVRMF